MLGSSDLPIVVFLDFDSVVTVVTLSTVKFGGAFVARPDLRAVEAVA